MKQLIGLMLLLTQVQAASWLPEKEFEYKLKVEGLLFYYHKDAPRCALSLKVETIEETLSVVLDQKVCTDAGLRLNK